MEFSWELTSFPFILLFITAQVSSQMLRVWLCQCEVWSIHIPLLTPSYGQFNLCGSYWWVYFVHTVEPLLTATLLLWLFSFGCWAKMTIHFLVKKPWFIRSPCYYGQIFWPIGDRINGVPLYLPIPGLKKNLTSSWAFCTNSSQISSAHSYFFLVLVNDFVGRWRVWTLDHCPRLPLQQLSRNEPLDMKDTPVKQTPRVDPCLSLLLLSYSM